ncbi:MAG: TIGR04255 family protein [Bacteroidetes bacterium]|nr:TIGR04255 family protein [Bacteroidota bacterium]
MSRYRNPPIIEAICEFHFASSSGWDPTLPGKLHAELEGDYVGQPRRWESIEFGVQIQSGASAKFQVGEGPEKVQLITENEKRIIGIGPDVLSIHMLSPYLDPHYSDGTGWVEFHARIKEALNSYWQVVQPKGVKKTGIRYINKIEVSEQEMLLQKYLKCAFPKVAGLPDQIVNLMSRVEYQYDGGIKLILSQGKVVDGFILDIDVIHETSEVADRNCIDEMIIDLRTRVGDVFESVITNKSRELFNASY